MLGPMAWTYILLCADGSYYVGSTRNLLQRLEQHASGRGCGYTSTRRPVELVWSMEFDNIGSAWRLERRIHGWGRAKREALIRGDLDLLPELSRSRTPTT